MSELCLHSYAGVSNTIKFFVDNKININILNHYNLTALMIIYKYLPRQYIAANYQIIIRLWCKSIYLKINLEILHYII